MTMPNVLYNGPGNWPDADKLMANYSYLENLANGYTTFRNRIINGDMRIDQRNEGASVTQTTGNLYPVDRWRIYGSVASKFTAQRNYGVTPPVGFSHHLGINSLSSYSVGAGEVFTITQAIEGFNVTDLAWGTGYAKTVTLSFWFRSNMSGGSVFGGSLQNSAGTRSYPFTFSSITTSTWEYKTITIPGDQTGTWLTDNGAGIVLRLGLGVGTSFSGTAGAWAAADYRSVTGAVSIVGTNAATYYITGVQLEAGSVATPYELLPMATQFQLCQRYFEKSYNLGVVPGTSTANGRVTGSRQTGIFATYRNFSVSKNATPTTVIYSPSTGTSARIRNEGTSTDETISVEVSASSVNVSGTTGTAGHGLSYHFTAEAEI